MGGACERLAMAAGLLRWDSCAGPCTEAGCVCGGRMLVEPDVLMDLGREGARLSVRPVLAGSTARLESMDLHEQSERHGSSGKVSTQSSRLSTSACLRCGALAPCVSLLGMT